MSADVPKIKLMMTFPNIDFKIEEYLFYSLS